MCSVRSWYSLVNISLLSPDANSQLAADWIIR
nr:MAG TPA: hypothetical protein [Caudoviricetes sp.]